MKLVSGKIKHSIAVIRSIIVLFSQFYTSNFLNQLICPSTMTYLCIQLQTCRVDGDDRVGHDFLRNVWNLGLGSDIFHDRAFSNPT